MYSIFSYGFYVSSRPSVLGMSDPADGGSAQQALLPGKHMVYLPEQTGGGSAASQQMEALLPGRQAAASKQVCYLLPRPRHAQLQLFISTQPSLECHHVKTTAVNRHSRWCFHGIFSSCQET